MRASLFTDVFQVGAADSANELQTDAMMLTSSSCHCLLLFQATPLTFLLLRTACRLHVKRHMLLLGLCIRHLVIAD
jgi:hypothetical protein